MPAGKVQLHPLLAIALVTSILSNLAISRTRCINYLSLSVPLKPVRSLGNGEKSNGYSKNDSRC
jgi:hypothetical protein